VDIIEAAGNAPSDFKVNCRKRMKKEDIIEEVENAFSDIKVNYRKQNVSCRKKTNKNTRKL